VTRDHEGVADRALALIVVDGTNEVRLPAGTLRIGRAPKSGLCLSDASLLPVHAQIISEPRCVWMRCSGPSWVNGRPVRNSALLHLGDRIRLGEVQLKLVANMQQPSQQSDLLEFPGQWALRALDGSRMGAAQALDEVLPGDAVTPSANGYAISRKIDLMVNGRKSLGGFVGAGDHLEIEGQRWMLESARWIPPSPYDTEEKPQPVVSQIHNPRFATAAAFAVVFGVWLALLIMS